MKRIILVLALLAVAGFAFAASVSAPPQDIDIVIGQVLLIAIDPVGSTITLNSGGLIAAGEQVTGDTDATTRLRYTVASSSNCRITAQLDAAAPVGTELHLTAAPGIGGSGGGNQGSTAGEINLTTSAQNIIDTIPSCYTGILAGNGALLTYDLVITGSPAFGTTSLQVTLTLTDAP